MVLAMAMVMMIIAEVIHGSGRYHVCSIVTKIEGMTPLPGTKTKKKSLMEPGLDSIWQFHQFIKKKKTGKKAPLISTRKMRMDIKKAGLSLSFFPFFPFFFPHLFSSLPFSFLSSSPFPPSTYHPFSLDYLLERQHHTPLHLFFSFFFFFLFTETLFIFFFLTHPPPITPKKHMSIHPTTTPRL